MNRDELAQRLGGLGFSALESSVFLCLLKNPGWNGSQVAKDLQLPRTTVYSVLDALETRSAAFKEAGETVRWRAETPSVLVNRLNAQWQTTLSGLEEGLSAWEKEQPEEGFWNISGRSRIEERLRYLISQSRREVLLATNWDVTRYSPEIRQALDRGVKIHLFSFCEQDIGALKVNFVLHPPFERSDELDDRVMVVSDQSTVLMASGQGQAYKGIWTSHKLLVTLASEHIHLDMYLMRLRQKMGRDPIEDDIRLGSLMEEALDPPGDLSPSGKK